jgi:hypothetical protein
MSYIKIKSNEYFYNWRFKVIVEYLGKNFSKEKIRTSNLRKGERMLADKLNISKTRIKSLYEIDKNVKIPYEVHEICNHIVTLSEKSKETKSKCLEMCKKKDFADCLYRTLLIEKHYELLSWTEKKLNDNERIIYKKLHDFVDLCV